MVVVFGERRIGMLRNRADRDVLDRVGWLLEKEWRFAGWVGAALDRVCGIVASDAIDAADLEYFTLADNRDGRRSHGKNRLRTGLRLDRYALGRGTRQRQ